MAKELDVIERRIGIGFAPLQSGSGGQQLINALQGFSKTLSGIAEASATENAAIQGMLARENNRKVNIRPGITRPTAAFNQAYRDTDARIIARSGLDMIAEATVDANNPAKINSGSVENFNNKIAGIIEGTLSQALPENRVAIRDAMLRAASLGKAKVQQSVINFENKNMAANFRLEYETAKEDLAALYMNKESDPEQIKALEDETAKILHDWGMINSDIQRMIPGIAKELSDLKSKAGFLGEFLEAQGKGQSDEYLHAFVQHKNDAITPQQKLDLISEMVRINNAAKSAQAGSQALSIQKLENDIDDVQSETHVQNQEQLESHPEYQNLTPLQKEQVAHKLIVKNSQRLKEQQKFANALSNIANGRAAFVNKSTINEMFLAQLDAIESESGQPANIDTQFAIVRQLQTNVPKFDALMSDMLTSGDTNSALMAGTLYSTVSLAKQDNLINLSGDAATIAEKMRTQLNMTANPPVEIVEGILKQVLQRNEPQVRERVNAANEAFNKNGARFFKDVMGVEPDPFQDQGAYAVFKDSFISAMVRGSTKEEAVIITKNAMRGWGTDNWFIDGNVGQAPPTKMLPMSEGNFNIRNQILVQFDGIKKANDKLPVDSRIPMRFVNKVNIPEGRISEDVFVFKPLDEFKVPSADLFSLLKTGGKPSLIVPKGIEVEVNGIKSNLKLVSSPETIASPREGLVYGLFAQDEFGIYQQIQDPRSPDGLAYIVLNDVNVTAPSVSLGESADERIISNMENARNKQRVRELEEIYLNEMANMPSATELILSHPSLGGGLGYSKELEALLKAKVKAFFEGFGKKETIKPDDIKSLIDRERAKKLQDDLDRVLNESDEEE